MSICHAAMSNDVISLIGLNRRRAFQEYVVNQAKERVHGLEAQLHQGQNNPA
jgi:hypothetical protein